MSVLGFCRIVGLMQVWHVAQRDKSLEIEGDQLTPESQYERPTRDSFRYGDERLLEIERIPIDRDQYLFARSEGALELRDYLNVAAKAHIREQFQPLQ